jgi:hypothetical protein
MRGVTHEAGVRAVLFSLFQANPNRERNSAGPVEPPFVEPRPFTVGQAARLSEIAAADIVPNGRTRLRNTDG